MSTPEISSKNVLVVAHGTWGDLVAPVTVGAELKNQGHNVTVAANEEYRQRIQQRGLEFVELGTVAEQRALMEHPDVYNGRRAVDTYFEKMTLPMIPRIAEVVRAQHAADKVDVLIRHPLAFGAEAVAKDLGIPTAIANPFPIAWDSKGDPRVYPHFPGIVATGAVGRVLHFVTELAAKIKIDVPLNRAYEKLGLPTARNHTQHELRGGDANLGMWSPHYRQSVSGDPAHGKVTGFALDDRLLPDQELDPKIRRFLDAGKQVVVFTLGTGVVDHAQKDFYSIAAEACQMGGFRGLLLVGNQRHAPNRQHLSDDVHVADYAPLGLVLDSAFAIVHHGGISTTAYGLRHGVPAIVIPSAYDQFDNAERVARLGAGYRMSWEELSPRALSGRLWRFQHDVDEVQTKARSIGEAMQTEEDGTLRAAREIASLRKK